MKKRIISLFVTVICLSFMLSVIAGASGPALLVDDADILTDVEEEVLLERLESVSSEYGADVVIVTVNSTGDLSPMEYADDYFDYNGYGQGDDNSGVLLLMDMGGREMWISTCGFCIEAIDDYSIEGIFDNMSFDIENELYTDAFNRYIDDCEYYIDGYINGYPTNYFMLVIVALVIGLIIALIVTGVMKGKLKSVRARAAAADYVKAGSMNVVLSNDLFLYRTITRTKKEENKSSSSTHRSSSGASHGGGGRSF